MRHPVDDVLVGAGTLWLSDPLLVPMWIRTLDIRPHGELYKVARSIVGSLLQEGIPFLQLTSLFTIYS